MKINPRITEQTQSDFVKVVTKRTKASRHIVLFIYAKATNIYRDSFTSGGGKSQMSEMMGSNRHFKPCLFFEE